MIDALRPPTLTHENGVILHPGGREIHVRSFPGHTGSDSVVVIPDARVVFMGDLFWRNSLPNMVNATTPHWIQTLDSIAKSESGYTFVPGHGDVGNTADVAAFRGYLGTLQSLVGDAQRQGKSGQEIGAAVLPALTERYGAWDFFKFLAAPNIADMDAELRGTKRIPR